MSEPGSRPTPPRWQSILAELKRRRVFRVMAIYGGGAFAFLEALDLLAGGLPIPGRLVSGVTVLVLAGFPAAVLLAWAFDLTPEGVVRTGPARSGELEEIASAPRRRRWPAGILALAGSILFLVVAWSAASRFGWISAGAPPAAYAVEDPLGSYVVLPFTHRGETEEERALAERAAARLTRQLRGWETIRVVSDIALAGVMHDLGIESQTLPSIESGLAIARAQRVGTLVAITTEVDGNSLLLESVLFDVASGTQLRQAVLSHAALEDLDGLVAPVTQEVLNLRDRDIDLATLRSESTNPLAHRAYQEGLDALYAWRLEEAAERFHEAIAQDSAFALPYHRLGQTLYWQTARNPERIVDRGPEIARLAQQADRLAGERGLRPGLRAQISAFRAFWDGDYESARASVSRLLDADSTDVEAWLLLGAIEYEDPMLTTRPDGSLLPRKDLWLSRRAFETAARLAPEFPLSYGRLFDIDRLVAESAATGSCPAYHRPEAGPVPPYGRRSVENVVGFCPVPGDSLHWLPAASFTDERQRTAAGEAGSLRRRTAALLERWAAVRPDQPRPFEEWAAFAVWERGLRDCRSDPAITDSLTRSAMTHLATALALRGDTTPEDRVRLAMLRLAAGDVEIADSLVERALEAFSIASDATTLDAPPPDAAANLFVATGRPGRAHEILAPIWAQRSFGAIDPRDESIVMAGPVEPEFGRAVVLGASGARSADVETALAELDATWGRADIGLRDRALLREASLNLGTAPALLASPQRLATWQRDWEAAGIQVSEALRGLAAAAEGDDTGAAALLDSARAAIASSERLGFESQYLAAVLAERLRRDAEAATLYASLRACPLSLDRFDSRWGLRTGALAGLARTADREGRAEEAEEARRELARRLAKAEPEIYLGSEAAYVAPGVR
jgi:tetratricopeptide (TPR) repeat protein